MSSDRPADRTPVPSGVAPVASRSGAPRPGSEVVPGATLAVFRLASAFTFLAVAMGSVVCSTNSGAGCPTWPGCRADAIAPQWESAPVIEFTHRVVAIGAGPLVLAAALLSLRLTGRDPWLRVLPWIALVGTLSAGTFGRLAVLSGISLWQGSVDLASALTAMIVMAVVAVRAGSGRASAVGELGVGSGADPAVGPAGDPGSGLVSVSRRHAQQPVRLAVTALVVLIGMHVAGLWTAGAGSFTRCLGWPVWHLVDGDRYPGLQVGRLVLAVVAVVLVTGVVLTCLVPGRSRGWAAVLGGLLVLEQALGLLIGPDAAPGLRAGYAVTAVVLLAALSSFAAAVRVQPLAGSPREAQRVTA